MKQSYFLLTSCLILSSMNSFAQKGDNFQKNYEPIRNELTDWDPVRGAWLADNLPAVINEQPVGVRNFPENMTPNQVLALVPQATRDRITKSITPLRSDAVDAVFWSDLNNFVSNVTCTTSLGRSYGDPHLKSYDGERFSFQTVGEFVLTKSDDSKIEVQTRQKAVRDDFSLNTAVAMNVSGDRVCLYGEDFPDGNSSTPVRVNGQAINVGTKPYFLNNGGVITRSGGSYIIDWPTGESVTAQAGNNSGVSFYNVSVGVNTCTRTYTGVLGNANGSTRDDFDAPGVSAPTRFFASTNSNIAKDIEKERLIFLAKDFADIHRVTQATSLFDYGIGQSTFTFTDRSFPRFHRSINDLDTDQRALAQQNCHNGGVRGADMEGCIYDNAFLNIPPTPEPPIRTPVDPATVVPVRSPSMNTNPEPPVVPATTTPTRTPSVSSGSTPSPVIHDTRNQTESPSGTVKDNGNAEPRPSTPTQTQTSRPTPTQTTRPTPTPITRPTPTPKTNPTPRPTPAPTPKPRPTTPRPAGRG